MAEDRDPDIGKWYPPPEIDSFMQQLNPGDGLEFDRGLFRHWAIYEGNGDIIHFNGEPSQLDKTTASIRRDRLRNLTQNSRLRVNNCGKFLQRRLPAFSPAKILFRARSKIGESGYNLFDNNCEHFVSWCRYGEKFSQQVVDAVKGVAVQPGGVTFLGLFSFFILANKLVNVINKGNSGK